MRRPALRCGIIAAASGAIGLALLFGGGKAVNAEAADDSPNPAADAPPEFEHTVRPFFERYCVECHGPEKQEKDLRLDRLSPEVANPAVAETWNLVWDMLAFGEMPPSDAQRQPPDREVEVVVGWVRERMNALEESGEREPPSAVMRRLTRFEYTNTLEDLLHHRFLPSESPMERLPQDGRVHGFHKVGEALPIDSSLLDRYFEIARGVAEEVLVEGEPEYPTQRTRFEYEDTAGNNAIGYQCYRPSFICRDEDIVLYDKDARAYHLLDYPGTDTMVPTKGWYRVRISAAAVPGEDGEPVRMRVWRPSSDFEREVTVEADPDQPRVFEWLVPMDPRGGNVIKAGIVNGTEFYNYNRHFGDYRNRIGEAGKEQRFREVLLSRARMMAEGAAGGSLPREETEDRSKLPRLILDYVEVEGPVRESWPPRFQQELLASATDSRGAVHIQRAFKWFMKRAWRRPVSDEEVAPILNLVRNEVNHGATFIEAVRVGVVAVLTSPNFVYLYEPSGKESRALSDWELASRLSYFLWSSMPDKELFELAEAGKLSDEAVLERQVDRMLASPKAEALVEGFGAQWLKTDEFRSFEPDDQLYPEYDEQLGADMVREAEKFFERILFEDRSALNFIDSDWSMLNERLAAFYGIEGVEGEAFRPVELPEDSPRGGVLTMAGVAMMGSDGTRTRPIERAKYVRDVLLNDPPDPPPGNVGELEPAVEGEGLTVRQRLARHRNEPQCMKCHRALDPYGMALENFNVIGQWRDRQDGEAYERMRPGERPTIDASGTLPNGVSFDGPAQFKQRLMDQKDRFLRALAEKMLIYALGREVTAADRPTVERLVDRMKDNGHTLRSLIKGIVTSEAFRRK